jgi:short-subunit dehydrogenase
MNGIDTLIFSAGGGDISKDLDWSIDKNTVNTNVNGFVETANWAFNYFVKQGEGRLAVISSIAAYRGNSWAPAYSASKAFQSVYFEGLHMKARALKKNVSVTCIEPGFVNTAMAKSDKLFWLVPVDKAARQIMKAIDKRKKHAYVSRRWYIIAKLLKWSPDWMLRLAKL